MNPAKLALVLASLILPLEIAVADSFSWKKEPTSLALLSSGKTVWQFNHDPAAASKPFFHPLAVPGGESLTEFAPADHPWHFGLWFSWKFINGVNYWEHDKATGKLEGTTTWKLGKIETGADQSARIELSLDYHPAGDTKPVLTEQRVITVSPPAADGTYFLDWDLAFQAGDQNVKLDRTPLPGEPDGKVFGGYAGLSFRFVKGLADCKISSTEDIGKPKAQRHRFSGKGADYSGSIGGKVAGAAILDHPSNPGFPNRWYAAVSPAKPFCFFNAGIIQLKPLEIPAGGNLKLHYRVAIHPGRWDSKRIEAEHAAYAKPHK